MTYLSKIVLNCHSQPPSDLGGLVETFLRDGVKFVGVVEAQASLVKTGSDVGCNLSQSDRGFGASYGAGLSARVAPRIELRFDWDRYRFPFGKDGLFSNFARVGGKRDVDMWSAGVNVLF